MLLFFPCIEDFFSLNGLIPAFRCHLGCSGAASARAGMVLPLAGGVEVGDEAAVEGG